MANNRLAVGIDSGGHRQGIASGRCNGPLETWIALTANPTSYDEFRTRLLQCARTVQLLESIKTANKRPLVCIEKPHHQWSAETSRSPVDLSVTYWLQLLRSYRSDLEPRLVIAEVWQRRIAKSMATEERTGISPCKTSRAYCLKRLGLAVNKDLADAICIRAYGLNLITPAT